MTTETFSEALHSRLAQKLEPKHFDRLMELATEATFSEDEIIFREDQECDRFYLILSGSVALEMVISGRTIGLQSLGSGDEFGWSSVLMQGLRHFQARSTRQTYAMAFEGSRLLDACRRDPEFGFAFMYRLLEVVAGRLEATRLKLLDVFNLRLGLP